MHAWLLPLAEALRDGMSPSPSEQPLPWTPLDDYIVCCLAEHGIRRASGLEQALEQIWHDENLKVSDLMSYVHCWPSHNANIVNIHIHAGAHRHSSRSVIEAMRVANRGFIAIAVAAAKVAELAF